MDIDVFVAAHTAEWRRLESLTARSSRASRLTGAELDELVDLYQRTATHLSIVRTNSPDPMLIDRLSSLVARGRSAVAGARTPSWRVVGTFLQVTFPAAVYRMRWWVLGTGLVCFALAAALGFWVALNPEIQASIDSPERIKALVDQDFEGYYSANPASSFAAQVFINNVWVSAQALTLGILLGIPTIAVLLQNFANLGVMGGLMAANGRGPLFFGLITPHGLIELSAVVIAGAAGLRIGWTVVDPGPLKRAPAVAQAFRSLVTVSLGLIVVLAAAGLIEAFVTPSGLPTAVRVGIGVLAEIALLWWIIVFGRRAVRAGATGDLDADVRGDVEVTV
ncbi:MAG: stage II sporulation protein M [Mycobacteriales bacterium]